jgi:hypothetical protein
MPTIFAYENDVPSPQRGISTIYDDWTLTVPLDDEIIHCLDVPTSRRQAKTFKAAREDSQANGWMLPLQGLRIDGKRDLACRSNFKR